MELNAARVFNFYFGPKLKVIHQKWGPRSSWSHFNILGLKNRIIPMLKINLIVYCLNSNAKNFSRVGTNCGITVI